VTVAQFAGQTYVRMDPVALGRLLRGPNGPVARQMIRDADQVRDEAKRLVGYSRPDPLGRPRRKPNHLRDTIVTRATDRKGEFAMLVGSNDEIALLHHEGTQPHLIRPRRAPALVFWSTRAGRVISTKLVRHPGTRPNRYLTDALRVLRRRY
jgi:hypothetical protein